MRERLQTFLAQVQAKNGTGLPEFVKDEFEAFLGCGILAHGFLRVRCADCAHEKPGDTAVHGEKGGLNFLYTAGEALDRLEHRGELCVVFSADTCRGLAAVGKIDEKRETHYELLGSLRELIRSRLRCIAGTLRWYSFGRLARESDGMRRMRCYETAASRSADRVSHRAKTRQSKGENGTWPT